MGPERLSREVFLMFAAVGWADGKLEAEEADAIARTALEEGLALEEVEELEKSIRDPVEMGDIDTSTMSQADRLYAYAACYWIAAVNGEIAPRERAVLDVLGHALSLTARGRTAMETAVTETRALPDGKLTASFELGALRRGIRARVEAEIVEAQARAAHEA